MSHTAQSRARVAARLTAAASIVSVLAVLLSACATGRGARGPMQTDRPDFTESAGTMPAGVVQIEAGHSFERADDVRSNTAGEVLVRVGASTRAEIRVALNSVVHSSSPDGTSTAREDAAVGTKVQLVPEREGRSFVPATSILLGTSLPTGSTRFRSSALTPEAKLAMGWALADTWGLASNLDVRSVPAAGRRAPETEASVSLSHALAEHVGMYAEWFGTRADGHVDTQYANSGVTWQLGRDVQLDARAGAGVGRAAGDYFFGAGLARRW